MKKLHEIITSKGSEYYRTKVIKYNDKIFKISYENRNGRQAIYVEVLTNNGDFKIVIGTHETGHEFTCSYVSSDLLKNEDSRKAIEISEKIIGKIFQ